jgi:hypothetical protein
LKLRINGYSSEVLHILQRLEDAAPKGVRKVDLPGDVVAESQPHDVVADVANLNDCD